MTEDINTSEDETSGHRFLAPSATDNDDVAGHHREPPGATDGDDDVAGHVRFQP